jgi:Lrp/AsnC family transcriptional regulator for asnA, asnC and gidA
MPQNLQIDTIDRKILAILLNDAKTPYTEIGKQVFVSGATVHVRVKKLQNLGIIKNSHIKLDYKSLGYDIIAFLGIYLETSTLYNHVAEKLNEIPEVVGLHYTTGVYSMFAKIVCFDTPHLRIVLHDKIQKVKGIQRTETMMSLEETINRPVDMTLNL